jgi:hypothetical protein
MPTKTTTIKAMPSTVSQPNRQVAVFHGRTKVLPLTIFETFVSRVQTARWLSIPPVCDPERIMIGRSPVRFALNDFALSFTLFPKALFTFRSHYFFAVGLGAPCLAFADGHLPVCTARSNCATLRRGVD